MTKVLITGANGLLGQKLVQLYEEDQDVEVIATGRGENRNLAGTYSYEQMDITSQEEVMQVIKKHTPDVVINTAAMTHVDQCELNPDDCWKLNVDAVNHLIEACEKTDSFLIHLSTDFIFDGEDGPYIEEDLPNPLSKYAESKLESEKLLKASGIRHAIARTMLVYGIVHDMSRSNIILWVKESLEQKKLIKVVNDQWRTPTLAEDLAKGCALIAKNKAEGVFHISGKDLLTPYDMAVATAEFFNLDKSLIEKVDASIFTQPAKRPPKTGFILDKARKELGYEPVTFTEGLAILKSQLAHA
ncbi:dTDP-4-dehydrorhamnose reductase [Ekhidna lutea]|uniref:dTDP-4-dehydrorhamnose reductase n=1 Tax=Ekhidna lutea TaxID=447679 RepID=A0A239EYA2_EKHLU|nr:SDR family oxidoreductase [Ekhidna lutea]SNS49656.1 dTDP-4-dehydrorhamnose reductase [Ekhidna lutea]